MGKRGNVKIIRIHKALAEAFIPNPNCYSIVNHIDENRANYSIDNLEWVTPKENTSKHIKLSEDKNALTNNRKLLPNDVVSIRENKQQKTLNELAKEYNVTKTTISNVIKRVYYKNIS